MIAFCSICDVFLPNNFCHHEWRKITTDDLRGKLFKQVTLTNKGDIVSVIELSPQERIENELSKDEQASMISHRRTLEIIAALREALSDHDFAYVAHRVYNVSDPTPQKHLDKLMNEHCKSLVSEHIADILEGRSPEETILEGKVLWWDARDGRGIIEDVSGNEYYFDSSAIDEKARHRISRKQAVIFEPNRKIKCCLCAHKVQVEGKAK